jgi:hypothetical protein
LNGGQSRSGIGGIGFHSHSFEAYARLPLRKGNGNAFLYQPPRGNCVGFKKETAQSGSEVRQKDSFSGFRGEDYANRLLNILRRD